jgi:hypothetical protein
MQVWKWIGLGYLAISFLATALVFVSLLREDRRHHMNRWRTGNCKSGYNLKWGGIGWWLLMACLPGINLIIGALFVAPHCIGHLIAVIEIRCSRNR